MKKYIIFYIFLFSFFFSCFAAGEEKEDTIGYVLQPHNIVITRSENKAKIYAEYSGEDGKDSFYFYTKNYSNTSDNDCEYLENNWNISLPYYRLEDLNECEVNALKRNKNKIRRFLIGADHIYLGWRFNYHNKGNIKNSFETGIRNIIGIGWQRGLNGPIFSIGAGIGMARYSTHDKYGFNKRNDTLITSLLAEKEHSYLDIFTLKIPLALKQPMGRYCSLSLGASLNINFYAAAETKTKIENINISTQYKGLQQRVISGDIFASINIFGVGLYTSWQPISLFETGFGPAVKGWSIGIDITSM